MSRSSTQDVERTVAWRELDKVTRDLQEGWSRFVRFERLSNCFAMNMSEINFPLIRRFHLISLCFTGSGGPETPELCDQWSLDWSIRDVPWCFEKVNCFFVLTVLNIISSDGLEHLSDSSKFNTDFYDILNSFQWNHWQSDWSKCNCSLH